MAGMSELAGGHKQNADSKLPCRPLPRWLVQNRQRRADHTLGALRVESAPRQEVRLPMSQALEIVFWVGVFIALYSYLLYPLLLTLLQRKRAPRAANPDDLPAITV